MQAVSHHGEESIDWFDVAEAFDGTRTFSQCRARYDRVLKPQKERKNKGGYWTKEEVFMTRSEIDMCLFIYFRMSGCDKL